MLHKPCTRRTFIATTAIAGAGLLAADKLVWRRPEIPLIVSAERAPRFAFLNRTIVLDGPRLGRLRRMAESLQRLDGDIVLRLDATDEHLIDVAAQQAGVTVARGRPLADGAGLPARVIHHGRALA